MVAQMVEFLTDIQTVLGSIPSHSTNSGDANMWYERYPYKVEIVGSTPTATTQIKVYLYEK